MSISRSQLGRSPAIVTYNGGTFFTNADIVTKHAAKWKSVLASMYGEVDKAKYDLQITVPLKLWGAWENLSILFPAYAITSETGSSPIGSSIYGTGSDVPLVIQARNGDLFTYTNAAITKLPDLYLGVDEDLFEANVEFTCIIGNGMNPETSGAYFTIGTNAYTDGAFAKTNYKRTRFTGAWGSITGWTTITPQKGFHVGWELGLSDVMVDGLGCVDKTTTNFRGAAKFIPIGPTLAQINANSQLNTAHGTLLSAGSADLVMTGNGGSPVVTLKNAGMVENGFAFGIEPLRVGEVSFETTRGFASGVPAAIATVA